MPTGKMHAEEVEIDLPLVQRLIASQFPQWVDLTLTPVLASSTDNAMFRLGEERVVRLPRISYAAEQVVKEQRWLPYLAPLLPLTIPTPLGKGQPNAEYPFAWSIYNWIEGENVNLKQIANPSAMAREIAHFLHTLHTIPSTDTLPPGAHNSFRGVPLASRDNAVRRAISELTGLIDTQKVTKVWETCLHTPVWNAPPVWIHGDIQSGNLLAGNGVLLAVIDFGCLGVGDPACDLIVAWNLLSKTERDEFRASLNPDSATWERGRGWALSIGLIALPYYLHTRPTIAEQARYTIQETLTDF
jgi:aminoglycoside phosphotransferase (APT) family kinase protein